MQWTSRSSSVKKRPYQLDFCTHAALAYPWRSACLSQVMPSFNSVIEMIGMNRANSENSITNHAKAAHCDSHYR